MAQLSEKYQNLIHVAKDNLPGLWDSLEFELSVQKILNIKDCTLPFAGIVLGRPSSLKTVGIELFRQWFNTYYTDNFSAKAFVSHSTAVKREEVKESTSLFLTINATWPHILYLVSYHLDLIMKTLNCHTFG